MGFNKCLHGSREGKPALRLDDRGPHLRHVRGTEDEASGGDWIYAGGIIEETRALPTSLGSIAALRVDLHRMGATTS